MTTVAICSETGDEPRGWRNEARRLKDVAELKKVMDGNIKRNPDYYRKRMELLDGFFEKHPSPVDIVIVLYGALYDAHHLAYHIEGNNLLFYRPKVSHRRVVNAPFLDGDAHPERTLLIFDSDMLTGNSMRETSDYFTGLGYDRSKMFGYLDEGYRWRQFRTPQLMQVDDLLKKWPVSCLDQ